MIQISFTAPISFCIISNTRRKKCWLNEDLRENTHQPDHYPDIDSDIGIHREIYDRIRSRPGILGIYVCGDH